MEKYNVKERLTNSGHFSESFKGEVLDYAKRYVDHMNQEFDRQYNNEDMARRIEKLANFDNDAEPKETAPPRKGTFSNWFRRKNK